jgi:hypothetical protein
MDLYLIQALLVGVLGGLLFSWRAERTRGIWYARAKKAEADHQSIKGKLAMLHSSLRESERAYSSLLSEKVNTRIDFDRDARLYGVQVRVSESMVYEARRNPDYMCTMLGKQICREFQKVETPRDKRMMAFPGPKEFTL